MAEEVLDRCRIYEPRLTSVQFFSHTTAAASWDLPLASFDSTRLHVSALPPAREPRTRGVTGHRLDLPIEHLTLRHGVPVPTASETWAQLGAFSSDEDLFAVGDSILTRRLAERADLEEATRRLARPGVSDLREGWILVRVVDHHLCDPVRFVVAPVERALRSRGWRP